MCLPRHGLIVTSTWVFEDNVEVLLMWVGTSLTRRCKWCLLLISLSHLVFLGPIDAMGQVIQEAHFAGTQ